MPVSRTRKIIVTSAAALGVAVGAAGVAAATGSSSPSTNPAAAETEHDHQPSYTSSVTTPEGAKPDGLATITPDQAAAAATSAAPGTAGTPELENENGNIVYGVTVTQSDGTNVDVKIDAGNGSILVKEADAKEVNGDESVDSEGNDTGKEATDHFDSTGAAEQSDGGNQNK